MSFKILDELKKEENENLQKDIQESPLRYLMNENIIWRNPWLFC